ncbi:hypothetical protein SAY87_025950 [Trapa incisa]|uniref:Uncharacterized protein n=1 Tax=Trapa incisa TaxID=236973 RepID=A0AAN7GU60_9MYRT|nr:hypothetical protein SAY87_025950 [Trapa incisa]
MNRKFGGSRAPTGTPSLAWSCVVVVVSLLAGASVVHNIYKPNLVRRFHCFLSLMDPARKVFDEISSKLCRQLQVLMETRRKSSAENDHGDGVTSKQLPVARTLHCVNILNSTWLDLLPNLKVGLELDDKFPGIVVVASLFCESSLWIEIIGRCFNLEIEKRKVAMLQSPV